MVQVWRGTITVAYNDIKEVQAAHERMSAQMAVAPLKGTLARATWARHKESMHVTCPYGNRSIKATHTHLH